MATLTTHEYEFWRDFAQTRWGMTFDGVRQRSLMGAVNDLTLAGSYASPMTCYLDLANMDLVSLHDRLLNGETRFVRDQPVFEAIRSVIIPEFQLRNEGRAISILSAGCSSGQEAYSLAMTAMDSQIAVQVVGIDIRQSAIDRACEGLYRPHEMIGVPRAWRQKYFLEHGDSWIVRDQVKSNTMFRRNDLANDYLDEFFDVIVCENLLIYYDERVKARMIERMTQALNDDGTLILGAADRLGLSLTQFRSSEFHDAAILTKHNAETRCLI